VTGDRLMSRLAGAAPHAFGSRLDPVLRASRGQCGFRATSEGQSPGTGPLTGQPSLRRRSYWASIRGCPLTWRGPMRRCARAAVSMAGRSLTAESRRARLARLDFCKWLELAQWSKRRGAGCESDRGVCHRGTRLPPTDTQKPVACRKGTASVLLCHRVTGLSDRHSRAGVDSSECASWLEGVQPPFGVSHSATGAALEAIAVIPFE
jgi:hypothetical protein